jgi:hypothetical protein
MKYIYTLCLICVSVVSMAQNRFLDCSVLLLNEQILVENYSPNATCKVSKAAKGWLTAGTITLGENSMKPNADGKFEFGVAIKDMETGTLHLFSFEKYKKVKIEEVLRQCKAGDSIVILTANSKFALPHNEIKVY